MPEHLSPGDYVEEVGFQAKSNQIKEVGTSTAGFVGVAEKGPVNIPKLVTSIKQFEGLFGNLIPDSFLAYSVRGFFENGGKRCYVVRVAGDKESVKIGLSAFEKVHEINILCIPDIMSMWLKDGPPVGDEKIQDGIKIIQSAMISQCENLKDRFAVLDSIRGLEASEIQSWKQDNFDSKYAAFYYPWIKVKDPISAEGGTTRLVPPSGHIAGIYSRTDAKRGVHKAPANEAVLGALDLECAVTHQEQDFLNFSGVNCIRALPGRGICVWGARTISNDPLWKYVNVRRLLLFLEESIVEGTQWAVFEPSDAGLWSRVKQATEQFLFGVWSRGALAGANPKEAFFVKCDKTTMTQKDIDNGRVIILIGVAPVKPYEFVIFRISLWSGGSLLEE